MLILTHILLLGKRTGHRVDLDCFDRIAACLRVLANPTTEVKCVPFPSFLITSPHLSSFQTTYPEYIYACASRDLFLKYCRQSFAKLLNDKRTHERAEKEAAAKRAERKVQPDALISFRQLRARGGGSSNGDGAAEQLDDEADVSRAIGQIKAADLASQRLKHLYQVLNSVMSFLCGTRSLISCVCVSVVDGSV